MEFLGDRGFTRVRANQRRFHREQYRKGGELGFGIDGIAKTYIDPHRNSGSSQLGLKSDAYAIVFVFFPESPSPCDTPALTPRLTESKKWNQKASGFLYCENAWLVKLLNYQFIEMPRKSPDDTPKARWGFSVLCNSFEAHTGNITSCILADSGHKLCD